MHIFIFALFAAAAVPAGAVPSGGRRFRGGPEVQSIEALIQESLSAANGTARRRHERIEATVHPVFQALPKNAAGRLAPKAVHYLVHTYFAMQHGWSLKGLDAPFGLDVEGIHDVDILQEKVPAVVEGLLESQHRGKGLDFTEMVAMVAVIEQIIVDESLELLMTSYRLNGYSPMVKLSEQDMHEIMLTYLILFRKGARDLPSAEQHQKEKMLLKRASGPVFSASQAFERDTVLNFAYAQRHSLNTFTTARYSFEMAAQVVTDLAEGYGKWQYTECMEMKDHLLDLDLSHSGRVPLADFHAQPRTNKYSFTESKETLREYGALDETVPSDPQVIIANYVVNPSNCIAEGKYFSVCCVSECEGLLSELAAHVQAPFAEAEVLLSLVSNMSSSSVDGPRVLPEGLVEKLYEIAKRHDGTIPLHSRLFAQWIHFAFPAECPYPWLGAKHVIGGESAGLALSAENKQGMAQWSDEEAMPLLDETLFRDSIHRQHFSLHTLLRLLAYGAALLMAVRAAGSAWQMAVETLSSKHDGKGDSLPLSFSSHAKSV